MCAQRLQAHWLVVEVIPEKICGIGQCLTRLGIRHVDHRIQQKLAVLETPPKPMIDSNMDTLQRESARRQDNTGIRLPRIICRDSAGSVQTDRPF